MARLAPARKILVHLGLTPLTKAGRLDPLVVAAGLEHWRVRRLAAVAGLVLRPRSRILAEADLAVFRRQTNRQINLVEMDSQDLDNLYFQTPKKLPKNICVTKIAWTFLFFAFFLF